MKNRLGFLDFEDEDSTFDVFKVRGLDDDSLIFGLTPFELTCFSTELWFQSQGRRDSRNRSSNHS